MGYWWHEMNNNIKYLPLGSVAFSEKGKKPKETVREKKTGYLPYIDIKAFERGVFENYTDGEGCNFCFEGDLLMVWDGSRFGLAGKAYKGAIGSTLVKINVPQCNQDFVYYFLKSKYLIINSRPKGTGTPHVNPDLLWNFEFPIMSIKEQEKAVELIEQLFSDLDNAIDNLKKAKDQIEVYRHATFKYAFDGKLTNLKAKEFFECKLKDITDVGTGATPKRGVKKYYENGSIPWVTSSCVNETLVMFSKEKITQVAINETNCKIFPRGSLIIAMYGEGKTRGKISELGIDTATNQACAVLVLKQDSKVIKEYVKAFLKNQYGAMRMRASGGVQPNLNLGIIKNWTIRAPKDSKDQHDIMDTVNLRLSVCDKMEETINNSLEQSAALRHSILKQAFEGKLTEEWRKHNTELISGKNSAKALLERIQKEREVLKNTKKRKK